MCFLYDKVKNRVYHLDVAGFFVSCVIDNFC